MENQKLDKIKELFIKVKAAHCWAKDHSDPKYQDKYDTLLERLEPIYGELFKLGVTKQFSAALFIFGPLVTDKLVEQFKLKGGDNSASTK